MIAGIQLEGHARQMFQAGSNFSAKTPQEILYQDFKTFHTDEVEFAIGQLTAMSMEGLQEAKEKLSGYIGQVQKEKQLDMVYVMLTDILEESTELIFTGERAKEMAMQAFHGHAEDHGDSLWLKGVVSRKKQMVPALMLALQGH